MEVPGELLVQPAAQGAQRVDSPWELVQEAGPGAWSARQQALVVLEINPDYLFRPGSEFFELRQDNSQRVWGKTSLSRYWLGLMRGWN